MVHAHLRSHSGLFIYVGAHTASCSHASTKTCSFPSYLRSCLLKKDRHKVPSLYLFRIQCSKSCMCNLSWVMGLQHQAWTSQPIESQIEGIHVLLLCWTQKNRLQRFLRLFLWKERVKYTIFRALYVSRPNCTDLVFDILLIMISCARATRDVCAPSTWAAVILNGFFHTSFST